MQERKKIFAGSLHGLVTPAVSRAQRSARAQEPQCAADPGPFQFVAVPDQRCTTSARPLGGSTSTAFWRARSAPHPGHRRLTSASALGAQQPSAFALPTSLLLGLALV